MIRYGSLPPGALSTDSELLAARFRRSGSERLRDGAKAFLRRVESLKSRRRKRQNREGVIISGPQVKLSFTVLIIFRFIIYVYTTRIYIRVPI